MMTVIRKLFLERSRRHFWAPLLVICVLFSGAAQTQANSHSGEDAHHLASVQHDGTPVAKNTHQDCHDLAKSTETNVPSKHSAMHSCCASACFPSFTTAEFLHAAGRAYSSEKLALKSDQAATSSFLKGLFKPPRRHG